MYPDLISIANNSECLLKFKGSKFIGLSFKINNESEVKEILSSLRDEKFPAATHYCYAYFFDADNYRANDDGEPSNSAGQPILRQIKSLGLSHVLVVVIRYYGGTKLGVSGLIEAYSETARLVLENSGQEISEHRSNFEIICNYQDENLAFRLIRKVDAKISDIIKSNNIHIKFNISSKKIEELFEYKKDFLTFELKTPNSNS